MGKAWENDPHRSRLFVLYGDLFWFYLAATPGLPGIWQISGRCEIGYDNRASLDASYVSSWSLISDVSPASGAHEGGWRFGT
jgi:lipopolysaccharide/colanic/teichoic acid biosynthesis glycosyltransferase